MLYAKRDGRDSDASLRSTASQFKCEPASSTFQSKREALSSTSNNRTRSVSSAKPTFCCNWLPITGSINTHVKWELILLRRIFRGQLYPWEPPINSYESYEERVQLVQWFQKAFWREVQLNCSRIQLWEREIILKRKDSNTWCIQAEFLSSLPTRRSKRSLQFGRSMEKKNHSPPLHKEPDFKQRGDLLKFSLL